MPQSEQITIAKHHRTDETAWALVPLNTIERALAEAKTLPEFIATRHSAEAARQCFRLANYGLEMQNEAAELKLRAERRAGEMLAGMEKQHGARPPDTGLHDVTPSVLSDLGLTKIQSHRWQQEAAVPQETFERHVAEVKAAGNELTSASVLRLARAGVHYSSETSEWYTPREIIDRAVSLLGEIDLDPCSNEGEPNVPARYHLTIDDNALARPWLGRIYMNPPYGREIGDWVSKLCAEYADGRTTEAVALLPSRTDTQWFRQLREFPRCFIWGRLRFSDGGNSAPFPSTAVYLGANLVRFVQTFGDIGDVYILCEN